MEIVVGLTAVAMIADWAAVHRGADGIEEIAKPLVMIGLIAAVLVGGAGTASVVLVLAALVFGLAGDVLLLPRLDRFVAGLGAFLVGHLAYLGAYVAAGVDPVLLVVGAVAATTVSVAVGRPIVAGATWQSEKLGRAVVAYVLVISSMWAAGIGTGALLAIAGTTLFVASDAVLGWNRFVSALPSARLLTHVPYHTGQALIAAWAIG